MVLFQRSEVVALQLLGVLTAVSARIGQAGKAAFEDLAFGNHPEPQVKTILMRRRPPGCSRRKAQWRENQIL